MFQYMMSTFTYKNNNQPTNKIHPRTKTKNKQKTKKEKLRKLNEDKVPYDRRVLHFAFEIFSIKS